LALETKINFLAALRCAKWQQVCNIIRNALYKEHLGVLSP